LGFERNLRTSSLLPALLEERGIKGVYKTVFDVNRTLNLDKTFLYIKILREGCKKRIIPLKFATFFAT
jgi:hypothetical protein